MSGQARLPIKSANPRPGRFRSRQSLVVLGVVLTVSVTLIAVTLYFVVEKGVLCAEHLTVYTVGFTWANASHSANGSTYFEQLHLFASGGSNSTLAFSIAITNRTGVKLPMGNPQCPNFPSTAYWRCSGSSEGWYGILDGPTGAWVANFSASSGGGAWIGLGSDLNGASLVLVSANVLNGTGDVLAAHGGWNGQGCPTYEANGQVSL